MCDSCDQYKSNGKLFCADCGKQLNGDKIINLSLRIDYVEYLYKGSKARYDCSYHVRVHTQYPIQRSLGFDATLVIKREYEKDNVIHIPAGKKNFREMFRWNPNEECEEFGKLIISSYCSSEQIIIDEQDKKGYNITLVEHKPCRIGKACIVFESKVV